MSDKIELNRRRVLGGLVTIGAAGAAVGAGTFAAFSDTETSSGNTIQAGTLDLNGTTSSNFPLDNLVPGDDPNDVTVTTDYDSNSAVDPVNVDLVLTLSENDMATTPDGNTPLDTSAFAQKIRIQTATLGDGDNEYDLTDGLTANTHNLDGGDVDYIDLDQVASADHTGLSSVNPGDTLTFTLNIDMPTEVGNDAQGDGVDLEVEFTANQP